MTAVHRAACQQHSTTPTRACAILAAACRALGTTDLNPVSGVGKVSQLVFAVVAPGAVLPNLVAGAIAEAGAQQAGDLMQVGCGGCC
jgi:hypothetical protein